MNEDSSKLSSAAEAVRAAVAAAELDPAPAPAPAPAAVAAAAARVYPCRAAVVAQGREPGVEDGD